MAHLILCLSFLVKQKDFKLISVGTIGPSFVRASVTRLLTQKSPNVNQKVRTVVFTIWSDTLGLDSSSFWLLFDQNAKTVLRHYYERC